MLTTLLSEMGKKNSNYKFKLEPILVLFLSLMLNLFFIFIFFIYFIQQVRHHTLSGGFRNFFQGVPQ